MSNLNSEKKPNTTISIIFVILFGAIGALVMKIGLLSETNKLLVSQLEANSESNYVGCYPEFKDDVASLINHGKKFEQTFNNLIDKLDVEIKKFDSAIVKMSKLTGTDLNQFAEAVLIEAINNLSPDLVDFVTEAMSFDDPMTRTTDFIIENSDKLEE